MELKIRRIDCKRNRPFKRGEKWRTLPLYERSEYKNRVNVVKKDSGKNNVKRKTGEGHTAKTQYRQLETNIPRKGTARLQSCF
jgi:hypothetical protein